MPAGKEQFRRAITSFRNKHVIAALQPLINFRAEVIADDEFTARGGADDAVQKYYIQHLMHCDKIRRHITFNPDNLPLGDKIAKAIDSKEIAEVGENPFGGDDIQNQSTGLVDLPYSLDGTDPDIPLNSQLKSVFRKGSGALLLGAIDDAIVGWTRLNSADRSRFITCEDSMRMYQFYQEILGYLKNYLGTKNRTDVAHKLPSQEPLGPKDSPNILGEQANYGNTTSGGNSPL